MDIRKLEPLYQSIKEQLEGMQLFSEIFHSFPDALLFITYERIITLCNAEAATLLHISAPIAFDTLFEDDYFGFSLTQALAAKKRRQRVLLTIDQQEMEISTFPMQQGMLLLLHDRQESAKLEKSARQAEQLAELGHMAAQLAHEIRNPLFGMQGFTSLLLEELQNPEQRKMVAAIAEGTETLSQLVTSILQYAKPQTLHFAPLDLAPFVEELALFMQGKVIACKEVESRIISADKGRLKLALLNLLHNGIEASQATVYLILTKDALYIKDKGCGVTPENLEKIFTPFFTTKSQGTGLGLAEAKKVVEAHGGKISIESTGKEGTTFKVWL